MARKVDCAECAGEGRLYNTNDPDERGFLCEACDGTGYHLSFEHDQMMSAFTFALGVIDGKKRAA